MAANIPHHDGNRQSIALRQEVVNVIVVATAVFLCAILGTLTRPYGLIAAFWPANPVLLGLFIRFPTMARPAGWISAFLAFVVADLITGSTIKITLWLTLGNLIGVGAGYFLLRRMTLEDQRLRRPSSVLSLLLRTIQASTISGCFGAVAAPVLFDRDPIAGWTTWFTAELVNNISILPVILTMPRWRWDFWRRDLLALWRKPGGRTMPVLTLGVGVLAGLWVGGPGAFAFPMPALLWCALSYSIATTATLALFFSMTIIVAISGGWVNHLVLDDFSNTMMSVRLGVTLAALGPIMVASARYSLAASESRWNSALESARQGVWDSNVQKGHTFYSPQWKAMLGFGRDEIADNLSEWLNRLHPDDRDRVQAGLRALQEDRRITQYEGEYRIRHKEGQWLWMLGRGKVIERMPDGRSIRMIGTQTDITEMKQAETQLAVLNERMQLAMRAGGIGIWEFDFESRLIIWDDRMHELYGLSHDSFSGHAGEWLSYIAPEEQARLLAMWEGDGTKESIIESEFRVIRRDGESRYMHSLARIIHDQKGRPIRALGTNIDVTVRRADRDQLAQAKEEAERASVAKSQFLAIMSHELRTPMTGVLGLADLVWLDQQLSASTRRYIDMMRKSARALLTILDDILDFSKIDAQKLVLEVIDFTPQTILTDVVELMRPSASVRGNVLDISISNLPDRASGDPTRLRQILYNLIGNAIKFTEGGRIELKVVGIAGDEQVELRFEVNDTGIGMTEAQVSALFNAFFQADASTTRRFGGTGLGLAISKRLIEAMGGGVQVSSKVGQGSRFSFNVFLTPSQSQDGPEEEISMLPAGARSGHILLAEDNEITRVLVVAMLEHMGYQVTTAENGAEAVAMVAQGDFDLVLMDMQMPEMDGPTATRHIRALPGGKGRLPVIGMSADVLAEHRDDHVNAGLDAYLTKPIIWPKLEAAIGNYLGQETDGPA